MAELKADVLVLGAGMVGVGAALHLQKKGRDTVLIDRHIWRRAAMPCSIIPCWTPIRAFCWRR